MYDEYHASYIVLYFEMNRLSDKSRRAKGAPAGAKGEGCLVVTSTPIGNLGDLSPRARACLETAAMIACEDTRHTGLMLHRLGITHGKLVSYHDHSKPQVAAGLLQAMQAGATVALVSDAGTPLLSDPGYKLVDACHENGVPVVAIPGPSALLAALATAGLPTDRFFFAGFLPPQKAKRQRELGALAALDATLVFYESPRRLLASLADIAAWLPGREIAVARELTKQHEETRRGTAESLLLHFELHPPKGEIVIIAGPCPPAAPADQAELAAQIATAMDNGLSRRDAVRKVVEATGIPRSTVYAAALASSPPRS